MLWIATELTLLAMTRSGALAMTVVYFFSHCEEWNDEAVHGLPRAYALAMTI